METHTPSPQKSSLAPIIIVVLIVVFAAGFYYLLRFSKPVVEVAERKKVEALPVMEDATVMQESSMIEDEKKTALSSAPAAMISLNITGKILGGTSSPVVEFNQADYDAALASDKLVILYFYADWCPLCKAEIPYFYAAMSELPDDRAIGFRVNFNDEQTDDTERTLAREYGIAYQHTKIFVKNGKRVLKSPETWDEARYDKEINTHLK